MTTHPLDEAATLVGGLTWFRVSGPGTAVAGAVSATYLLDNLDEWLARITTWLNAEYGPDVPPVVPATYLMEWYVDAFARLTALYLEGHLIALELLPENVTIALEGGLWPTGAGVTSTSFWCLADHPAAGHPDARVIGSAQEATKLRDLARARAFNQLEEFYQRFQPAVKISSLQRVGMFEDRYEAALTDAADACGNPPIPLKEFRESCCFAFKLDPALLCTRCPRNRRPLRLPAAIACPTCGAEAGLPIIYGLPGPELQAAFERGEAIRGGCMMRDTSPNRGCVRCGHSWRQN